VRKFDDWWARTTADNGQERSWAPLNGHQDCMRLAYKIAGLAWAAGCAEGGLLAQKLVADNRDATWEELRAARAALNVFRSQAKTVAPSASRASGSGAALSSQPREPSAAMPISVPPAVPSIQARPPAPGTTSKAPPWLPLRYRYYAWLIGWEPDGHCHRRRSLWRVLFPAAP
jgi:hypothetical protein